MKNTPYGDGQPLFRQFVTRQTYSTSNSLCPIGESKAVYFKVECIQKYTPIIAGVIIAILLLCLFYFMFCRRKVPEIIIVGSTYSGESTRY